MSGVSQEACVNDAQKMSPRSIDSSAGTTEKTAGTKEEYAVLLHL
jgi:hypothetical protein